MRGSGMGGARNCDGCGTPSARPPAAVRGMTVATLLLPASSGPTTTFFSFPAATLVRAPSSTVLASMRAPGIEGERRGTGLLRLSTATAGHINGDLAAPSVLEPAEASTAAGDVGGGRSSSR